MYNGLRPCRLGKFGKLERRHPSTYGFFSLPAVVVVLQTRGTRLVFICTPSITVLFIHIKYDANDINVRTGRAAGSRRYNADRQTDGRTCLIAPHIPTWILLLLFSCTVIYYYYTRDGRCICAAYYCTHAVSYVCAIIL